VVFSATFDMLENVQFTTGQLEKLDFYHEDHASNTEKYTCWIEK